MTEDRAAEAAASEQGSRNLVMRVAAALVLAPVAIAIAYAGGFLWTVLVTLAVIGLYVEWLAGSSRLPRRDFASWRDAWMLRSPSSPSGWLPLH